MAHDLTIREQRRLSGEWERLVIGFKGEDQGPLVMIWKEYRKNRCSREVLWADCLFSTGTSHYFKLYLWEKPMSIWKGRVNMRPRWRKEGKLSWSLSGERWCFDIDFFSFAVGIGMEISNGSCFLALPFFLITRGAK